jgi:phage shock protein PspC (stress-responsive transcriptional regulator)
MKKTLSVNLAGTVYHIDEDAYSGLTEYLQDVKKHLGNEASSEEVLNDIEQRIGELFNQWMQGRREVITTQDVERVIGILGRPEQYDSGSAEEAEPDREKTEATGSRQEARTNGPHRRLYRDTENAVLGGVCSGMAHYLNVSPVLLRLLVFLLIWFGGTGVLFYIVCWIIIPEARTAAQRLEMQGEDVTIDNIEKKVREEYGKVKDRVDGYVSSNRFQQNTRSLGNGILEVIRVCFKVFFAFIAGIVGLAGFAALLALLVALIVLLTGNLHFITPWPVEIQPLQDVLMDPASAIWMIVGLVLVIGIPFIGIFRMLFSGVLNLKPSPKWAIWVSLLFWLIGVGLCIYSGMFTVSQSGGVWI